MNTLTKIFIIKNINNISIKNLEKYIYMLYKKDRIMSFFWETDKIRGIISEILIRIIYCQLTNLPNQEIIFKENEFKKPFIENCKNFKFNISHSNDIIVAAIDNEEVGIDIELIKELSTDIANVFCTDNEYLNISNSLESNRNERIIATWSMKEAYVKYLGTGLNKELKSFDIITKDGIDNNVNMYQKKIDEYILSFCSTKAIDLDNIIKEITIKDLLDKFELVI